MSGSLDIPFRPYPFMARAIMHEVDEHGINYLKAEIPLGKLAPHIPSLLNDAATNHPDRIWLAERRGSEGGWETLTYRAAKLLVDAVTQALLNMQRPGASVVVLSANSIEHAILQLAAMQARMPYVAITPAYSLIAQDFSKLKAMVSLVNPAVVFVQEGLLFERALAELELDDSITVACVEKPIPGRRMSSWADWVATVPGVDVKASIDRIECQTVAKYLFSSGSTGIPKAITMTQKMLVGSVAMHETTLNRDLVDPPVQLSWLPWSHVAGGNGVFNGTIAAAGTLYLDDGKPVSGMFEKTLRNLREVSPTQFASVPAGYVMLVEALEADAELAGNFFRKLRMMSFSGARMPEFVCVRMQELAVRYTGYRIPFVSGWGLTETCAAGTYVYWNADSVGLIGLPQPEIELKLMPLGDSTRFEVRVRGIVVTPGYLNNPEQTAAAFDEDGFFKTGDAVQFVDASNPEEGLAFAGRVAEEFKLQTGTFVRVGALRVQVLESALGLLSDVVVTGADEAFIGLLAWPNLDRCRAEWGGGSATIDELIASDRVRNAIKNALSAHNVTYSASSMRIKRILLLKEPPSLAAGEITDKGYVNQRAVLQCRSDLVAKLYAPELDPDVIEIA